MSNTVIKIENLSKQYRLGVWGSSTLRDEFAKGWAKLLGKPDPTLTISSSNTLDTVDESYVWALRDINLEVKQGEVLGIIGKNGAGKSTLLKILSRVTSPTTGSIKIKGRIASLLEVGTGMHLEMTGRENIFLNGAILGMTKWEIKNKFDEIVDFAGIAKYVDTPIKRYSSGMRVRLGFAIAAFLDPEILIVDEVLAVGDAEFQKKAIGKMQDVSKGEGRTVLFVSHNMNSVANLCENGLILKNGGIELFDNNIDKVIEKYLQPDENKNTLQWLNQSNSINNNYFKPISLKLLSSDGNDAQLPILNNRIYYIELIGYSKKTDPYLNLAISIRNEKNILVYNTSIKDSKISSTIKKNGDFKFLIKLPTDKLNSGYYKISLIAKYNHNKWLISPENSPYIGFDIINNTDKRIKHNGAIIKNLEEYSWEIKY